METEESKVSPLVKWSSMELVEEEEAPSTSVNVKDGMYDETFLLLSPNRKVRLAVMAS